MGRVVARSLWVLGLWLAVQATAETAWAEPVPPCAGCRLSTPSSDGPAPLLVVLHGDEGSPTKLYGAWKAATEKAGVVLFAPRCPTDRGCSGSWWRWDGDPSWLIGEVSKLEGAHAIDPARRYLAGWSGGTTYLTFHMRSWFPTFVAVSLAGGGAPSRDGQCLEHAGGECAPIHWLAGDRNPLFSLAEAARTEIEQCGHDVTWELHQGADHAGEWRAYQREVGDILGWLSVRSQGCGAPLPAATSATATSTGATSTAAGGPRLDETTPAPSRNASVHAANVPPFRREGRCTCSVDEGRDGRCATLGIGLTAAVIAFRRRGSRAASAPPSRARTVFGGRARRHWSRCARRARDRRSQTCRWPWHRVDGAEPC